MYTTKQRVDLLEDLLREGARFEVWHFSRDGRQHAVTIFEVGEHSRACYPFTNYSGGVSMGGGHTEVREAAKEILRHIRDYHDIIVEELAEKIPLGRRKGCPISIVWPQSQRLKELEVFSGAIFCGDLKVMTEINRKKDEEARKNAIERKKIHQLLKKDIEKWKKGRKEHGYWDADEDIDAA